MDYAQDQADEIEALESIYAGGLFDKLSETPPYKVASVPVFWLRLAKPMAASLGARASPRSEHLNTPRCCTHARDIGAGASGSRSRGSS
jgi:hypothetical protein